MGCRVIRVPHPPQMAAASVWTLDETTPYTRIEDFMAYGGIMYAYNIGSSGAADLIDRDGGWDLVSTVTHGIGLSGVFPIFQLFGDDLYMAGAGAVHKWNGSALNQEFYYWDNNYNLLHAGSYMDWMGDASSNMYVSEHQTTGSAGSWTNRKRKDWRNYPYVATRFFFDGVICSTIGYWTVGASYLTFTARAGNPNNYRLGYFDEKLWQGWNSNDIRYIASKGDSWHALGGEPAGYNLQHSEGTVNGLYVLALRTADSKSCILFYDGVDWYEDLVMDTATINCIVLSGETMWMANDEGEIWYKNYA